MVDDPRWHLFGELAVTLTNLKDRVSDGEGNDITDCKSLSSADMPEIMSNVTDKIGLTVASCSKLWKYAVGFGVDKTRRTKAALLALSATMACDAKHFAQIRTLHPEFVSMCEKAGIETGSGVKTTSCQPEDAGQDKNVEEVMEGVPNNKNDDPSPRLQGIITDVKSH